MPPGPRARMSERPPSRRDAVDRFADRADELIFGAGKGAIEIEADFDRVRLPRAHDARHQASAERPPPRKFVARRRHDLGDWSVGQSLGDERRARMILL